MPGTTRSRPPLRLAPTPHLATLYLRCSNRADHLVAIAGLALLSLAAAAALLVWIKRAAVAAAFLGLREHPVMIALFAGLIAAPTVSHRRSAHAAR